MSREVARILWQCRRGMLELDVMLERFVQQRYESLTLQEQEVFEQLLQQSDDHLFSWLMGTERSENPQLQAMVEMIKSIS
jgi:antitoxin CptB